jgi:phosphoserine phosphatase
MDVEVVPERDESGGAGSPGRPLVVDMDGTLIRSDLLVESFFALLSTAPHRALLATVSLVRGRAAFKARVGKEVTLNLRHLPLSDAMVSLLRDEKAKGRRIYLASAGHGDYVRGLAEELGLFDGVFACRP